MESLCYPRMGNEEVQRKELKKGVVDFMEKQMCDNVIDEVRVRDTRVLIDLLDYKVKRDFAEKSTMVAGRNMTDVARELIRKWTYE